MKRRKNEWNDHINIMAEHRILRTVIDKCPTGREVLDVHEEGGMTL
jgi:hypothetical protein